MMTDAVATARQYTGVAMLVLQVLLFPAIGWLYASVSALSEQLAVMQSQVLDLRQGGVYTPEQASRAHDRIDRVQRDHEARIRELERSDNRGGRTSRLPPGR